MRRSRKNMAPAAPIAAVFRAAAIKRKSRNRSRNVAPMRSSFVGTLFCLLLYPAFAQAQAEQKPKFLAKIDQVRIGFRSYGGNETGGQFKTGMWVPVYVDVT